MLASALIITGSISAVAQQRGWPVATNNKSGFVQIFDGKSLDPGPLEFLTMRQAATNTAQFFRLTAGLH